MYKIWTGNLPSFLTLILTVSLLMLTSLAPHFILSLGLHCMIPRSSWPSYEGTTYLHVYAHITVTFSNAFTLGLA